MNNQSPMTKSVEQARRELFEATVELPDGAVWCPDQAKYIGMNFWLADYAWHAFNAALDAVVIELPKPMVAPFEQEFDVDYEAYEQAEGHCIDMNLLLGRCRASIESTGLGLKIK